MGRGRVDRIVRLAAFAAFVWRVRKLLYLAWLEGRREQQNAAAEPAAAKWWDWSAWSGDKPS
jgi:hypothetical protein